MDIEYNNGVRVTKFRHEMDTLEFAISEYERKVKEHFAANQETGTDAERSKRKKEALQFLEIERQKIKTLLDIQVQLDEYRKQGLKATHGSRESTKVVQSVLAEEKHHPTDTLETYMRAEGVPKPSNDHTAHHIVPGKGKLPKVTGFTRLHMHSYGIRINDPANGVYLIHKDENTPHWSMPRSRGHLKYHTYEYEQWINNRLLRLHNIDVLKTQLQVIGRILQENEPKTAMMKIQKGHNK